MYRQIKWSDRLKNKGGKMQKGDIEYFFTRYYSMVFRVAYMEVKSKADADDITQEVFIRVLGKAPEFASEEHEKAWIIRVTINLCRDLLKSKWNRDTVGIDNINIYECVDFAGIGNYDNEVLSNLCLLDEKYRRPLYLFYYEDYSVREISELLAVPENTVKTNLRRGRKKLGEMISKERENI